MSIVLKIPNRPRTKAQTKAASTAFAADSAVTLDSDGTSTGFTTAASTTQAIAGIMQQVVASTDSDYATATAQKNLLVDEDGIWEVTATGTAVADDEGGYFDFNSTTGLVINVGATTYQPFQCSKFISATLLRGTFTTWQSRINTVNAD
jgi:hypothetical protein